MGEEKKTFEPVKRTVAVGIFPYFETIDVGGKPHRVRREAARGDEITLTEEADVLRGDRNDHFVKPGEKVKEPPSAFDLSELGLMTDEQLAELWDGKQPKVDALIEAVGEDATLAKRVLDAENAGKHKPRPTLVEKLETIVAGSGA